MLESVAGNHGFVDGNKRTGWLLTELLIDRSGYEFTFADDEPIDDFVVAVVTHQFEFAGIVAWFAARLRPKSRDQSHP
jgi:death-on-curing protein